MASHPPSLSAGTITDVAGIAVGHFSDPRRPTGCTVVIARGGAVAAVDARGAAPGTRETALLDPSNTVERIHAVLLTGGSAFGLAAADGAVRWLEEHGIGLDMQIATIPIVPAAVLFDLPVATDRDHARIRPDAAAGYAACAAASTAAPAEGNVGAGSGAIVGKLFGANLAMKGGIGSASVTVGGITVGAIVACNALGDVVDTDTGRILAGARTDDGLRFRDTRRTLLAGEPPRPLLPGANTTIGVIATDARLTKAQAQRIATVGHDGLARAINPVHTTGDGDVLFALSTGTAAPGDGGTPGLMVLGVMAAEAVARATVRAVQAARSLRVGDLWLPAAADFPG